MADHHSAHSFTCRMLGFLFFCFVLVFLLFVFILGGLLVFFFFVWFFFVVVFSSPFFFVCLGLLLVFGYFGLGFSWLFCSLPKSKECV